MKSFAEFYSEADFSEASRVWMSHPGTDLPRSDPKISAWSEAQGLCDAAFQTAALSFLRHLRDEGDLRPVPFSEGRGHRWADAWNRFLDGSPARWDEEHLSSSLLSVAIMLHISGRNPQRPESGRYLDLVSMMDRGEFDSALLSDSARDVCDATGARLSLRIEPGWLPSLGVERYEGYRRVAFDKLESSAPSPEVLHLEIPVPSGELIAADWLRLEDELFTKIVDSGERFDINTSFGCAEQTRHYAEKFGFVSVFVGNSSPALVRKGSMIVAGKIDEPGYWDEEDPARERRLELAAKGWSEKNRITTDLWWATLIDRQVLEGLLATRVSPDQARSLVDGLLSKHSWGGPFSLRVPKGTLHLSFTAERESIREFQERSGAIDWAAFRQAHFVLSSEKLDWDSPHKPKPPKI